jgi:hypothetical protein
MDIGMLWFDDSPRTIDEKIKRAVDFYVEKYGRTPTLCMVNPATAKEDGLVAGVQVRPARSVLPHHFMVGIEDEKSNGSGEPSQLVMDLEAAAGEAEVERPKRRRQVMPAMDGQAA